MLLYFFGAIKFISNKLTKIVKNSVSKLESIKNFRNFIKTTNVGISQSSPVLLKCIKALVGAASKSKVALIFLNENSILSYISKFFASNCAICQKNTDND